MARGGGASPAPSRGQVYLPEWRRLYDRLLKMLREEHMLAEELSVQRAHLLAELEFQRIGRRESEEIFQARIQKILRDEERRRRVEKAETAVLVGGKDLESRCYQKLLELADTDAEDLRSHISILAAENSELKAKLKDAENQAELNGNNVDHQHGGKDLRLELRKLKQAYKTLNSEKEKQLSSLTAEKDFVWNQFKTMEQEYIVMIKNKNIEAKQATEAAQKLQQNIEALQVEGQKKDNKIIRLRVEVAKAKEKILILENELEEMHSFVKGRGAETDKDKDVQPETNRKTKTEGPLSKERLRTSQLTPDTRDLKTSRTRASETNNKRKRKSSLSCGSQRCSIRVLQVRDAMSPVLPPSFMVPKLKIPTPSLT